MGDDRLDKVEEEIEEARHKAEEDVPLFDKHPEKHHQYFFESGEENPTGDEREDDQTIAPPG